MFKYILLIALSIACSLYAANSIREIVFNDPTPFSIKCLGIKLDASRQYDISNSRTKRDGSIQIEYPNGAGLLPETLGHINHDVQSQMFALTVANDVSDKKDNSTNPFFAYVRTADKDLLGYGNYSYFDAGEKITHDLAGDGVVFNSPAGDKNSRVGLRIIGFDNGQFLTAKSEGLGVIYPLESGKANKFSVLCSQKPSFEALRAFSFTKSTDKKCDFTIEATPSSTFHLNYQVSNADGRSVVEGNENQLRFVVGDYLFEFTPSYSYLKLTPMLLGLLIIAAFQFLFLKHFQISGSPTIQAVIAVRILFNCLAFLSVPLYLTVTNSEVTSNRSVYWFFLVLFNATYVTHIFVNVLRDRHIVSSIKAVLTSPGTKIVVGAVLIVLSFMIAKFASGERLGPVPVLHVVKVAILLGMYTIYDFIPNRLFRSAIVLAFAGTLSYFASDFGSIIYCSAAFALIAFFSGYIWKWKFGLTVLVLFTILLAIGALFATSGSVAGGKGYRLYAQYVQPDSEYLQNAREADRETYAHLNLIQKQLIEGDLPEMRNVVVPASMRTTAFSDYALFWSLVYGKQSFAILFGLTALLLLYQLSFLLILTIRPIKIGNGMAYLLPATRESEFIQFLLSLTIVTIAYPILSNLLIAPLTGQSLPNISISLVEPLFLALLLITLSIVFMDRRYEQPADPRIIEDYRGVLASLKTGWLLVIIVFFALLFMRWTFVQLIPNDYRWAKTIEAIDNESGLEVNSLNAEDKNSLVDGGRRLFGDDSRMSVNPRKKPLLRNLASLYYAKVPYSRIRIENAKFELTGETLLRRMNAASYSTIQSKQVSGERAPFGRVMAFEQYINGKSATVYTNDYYASIPPFAKTINADLTGELSKALELHLEKIGVPSNIGSVLVVNNKHAGIVVNSSYPLAADTNSNEIHYLIGSLKKPVLAYAALAANKDYKDRDYNNLSFADFLKKSDDLYAAILLREVMQNHADEFGSKLLNDLSVPLISATEDAFFDEMPSRSLFSRPLDRNNPLYRYAIGQEKPYRFVDVVEWYSRIASGKKLVLNYTGHQAEFRELSISPNSLAALKAAMNSTLSGTALVVGEALERNGFNKGTFIAKTGTAEHSSGNFNSSSSIVIANKHYTIGIMLSGKVPENSKGLAAKDLMTTIIPTLKKYNILNR